MSATRGQPRRRWASGTDQILAGLRYIAVFGDLEIPPRSVLEDALSTIAAAGPHTRIGMTPQSGRRVWNYDPAAATPVHQLPDDVASGSSAALLQHLRRRPGVRRPLELHVSERHIVFDVDHGIGDGHFVLELLSALFTISAGGSPPWVTKVDTPLALPRALAHAFRFQPARAREAWKYAAGLRSGNRGGLNSTSRAESKSWSPSFALALANVDADTESTVNEWRRRNVETFGSAAVWLYIVRQALHTAGLPIRDEVMIAFNCRRYLPTPCTANGNFIIGLEIPLAAEYDLPTACTRLREFTASTVPIAGMGAISARALMRAGRRSARPYSGGNGEPARLMYTDLGKITSLDDLPWRDENERSLSALLDPAGPDSMTVFTSRIGPARTISISFHDNVFDRQIIDTAAAYLQDPMRFLESKAIRRA